MDVDKIICGDCLEEMPKMPAESVDTIFTDPPYGINKGKVVGDEDLSVWINSIPESYRVLKNNSFYCSFVGITTLPTIMAELVKFFSLRWINILYINNGMVRSRVGFSCYMPLLIFEKGHASVKSPMRDVIECSTNSDEMLKRKHPYQKDLDFVSYQIEHLTHPGDLILDPFVGSGTMAVAAKRMNRHYIGIELSEEYCAIARKRIAAIPARLDRWI